MSRVEQDQLLMPPCARGGHEHQYREWRKVFLDFNPVPPSPVGQVAHRLRMADAYCEDCEVRSAYRRRAIRAGSCTLVSPSTGSTERAADAIDRARADPALRVRKPHLVEWQQVMGVSIPIVEPAA